jgi:hypothetical protein
MRRRIDQYGEGVGPLKLGMTPDDVNGVLPTRFRSVEWDLLPVAGEYGAADVRHLYVPFRQLPLASPFGTELLRALPGYECWSGQSNITLLFYQCVFCQTVPTGGCSCRSSSMWIRQ